MTFREYEEADAQIWGEAPPRDAVDEYARESDPFQANPCPVRSSITMQECLLPAGHPPDSPNRFHRYAAATTIRSPRECPGCGRLMSFREEDEQAACNDCSGGVLL